MEDFFNSEEFNEYLYKFCSGLSEDVKSWDSFWNLLFYIYNNRAK